MAHDASLDTLFMARALKLAARGMWTTSPNPRVGCVLVRDGQIVGEGWHEKAGEPHAEVHALRAAGEAARRATAYVTLEPCSHHGRTPPCADALVAAGVARVVAANTMLPTGDFHPGEAFLKWREYSQTTPEFNTGKIVAGGCATEIPPDVVAAYDAPFPDERYKEGARQFPTLVPVTPDDPATPANRAAWQVLFQFRKPFLCAFSDKDKITAAAARA